MADTCLPGVFDCAYDGRPLPGTCAAYNEAYPSPGGQAWLIATASAIAAVMAFGIGANDSANSWGTSVGSKAISCRNACLLGGVFELLGAVALGAGVSGTIKHGVADTLDPDCWACGYCDSKMSVYAIGMFSALVGAAVRGHLQPI